MNELTIFCCYVCVFCRVGPKQMYVGESESIRSVFVLKDTSLFDPVQ
jgi:hypothetical protein